MFAVFVKIVVNVMYCLGLSVCRFKLGNYPSYRGNSAEISLESYNLEFLF